MDRPQRLRLLVESLRRTQGRSSSRELADRLGVSLRTIERDLASLRSQGIQLNSTPGRRGGVEVAKPEAGSDPLPWSQSAIPSGGYPFVGRAQEVATLDGALHSAMSGSPSVVTISGEPGIGKSRLSEEFAAIAQSQGTEVYWGKGSEDSAAPPYWPWIEILREICANASDEQLRRFAGDANSGLSLLVPYFREIVPVTEEDFIVEPAQARFELFDAVTAFLRRYSEETPLLLIFDDVHEADRASLSLLAFLAERVTAGRLCVLITFRSTPDARSEALDELLSSFARTGLVSEVIMVNLEPEAIRQYLEAALGEEPAIPLLQIVNETAEGNPLYLTEIARLITTVGAPSNAGDLALPDSLRATIARRLSHVSVLANEILSVAALIGREFDSRILASILDRKSDPELSMALSESVLAGLIAPTGDGRSGYRFTHALIGRVAAEKLAEPDAHRLHRDIAEAVEEFYPDDPDEHLDEIAHHYLAGELESDPRETARYCWRAGERAYERHAFEDAHEYFLNGLERRRPYPHDQLTAGLLRGLGRSQLQTMEFHESAIAVESLTSAFDLFLELGDTVQALETASIYVNALPGVSLSTELISRAIELAPPNSPELAALLARYGITAALGRGDLDGGLQALTDSLEFARANGDTGLEARALAFTAHVKSAWLQRDIAKTLGTQALSIARQSNELKAELNALTALSMAELYIGNVRGALSIALDQLKVAETAHSRHDISACLWTITRFCRDQGLWDQAREYSDRGLSMRPRYPVLLSDRAVIEYWLGDEAATRLYFDRLMEETKEPSPGDLAGFGPRISRVEALAQIGTLSGDQEMLDLARNAIRPLLQGSSAPHFHRLAGLTTPAMIVTHDDDIETAKILYKEFRVLGRDTVPVVLHWAASSLAWTAGEYLEARDWAEGSVQQLAAGGARLFEVQTAHGYAQNLIKRANQKDLAKARSLIAAGLKTATELGMVRHADAFEAMLTQIGPAPERSNADIWSLTRREFEVLELIDSGLTNRAISETLIISEHTVLRHVSNILSKMSASNRTEAASKARTAGMFQDKVSGNA